MQNCKPNDAALLVRIAGGDAEALVALYDRYAAVLMGLAQIIVGSGADAEAVVHDALLDVWRGARGYLPHHGTVRAWLILKLRARALDAVSSQPELACQVPPGRFIAKDRTASLMAFVRGTQAFASERLAVKRALRSLAQDQRQVLELAYFGRNSLADIATEMHLPVEIVRNHLASAHHDLRYALQAVRR